MKTLLQSIVLRVLEWFLRGIGWTISLLPVIFVIMTIQFILSLLFR